MNLLRKLESNVYILSGNYREFKDFCLKHDISYGNAVFINSTNKIRCCGRFNEYYAIGTYRQRLDWGLLKFELAIRGWKEIKYEQEK